MPLLKKQFLKWYDTDRSTTMVCTRVVQGQGMCAGPLQAVCTLATPQKIEK
jgi:hypothetical protein